MGCWESNLGQLHLQDKSVPKPFPTRARARTEVEFSGSGFQGVRAMRTPEEAPHLGPGAAWQAEARRFTHSLRQSRVPRRLRVPTLLFLTRTRTGLVRLGRAGARPARLFYCYSTQALPLPQRG